MRRHRGRPRDHWQQRVESQGLTFHTVDGFAYWDERAYYAFSSRDIDALEAATQALHAMCLDAVQHAVDERRLGELGVPEEHWNWVAESWVRADPALYGRFDLAYDGTNPPKLLEYNADTPTALAEAAVAQWYWMQDCFPRLDQWNSIHEQIVSRWPLVQGSSEAPVHFACLYELDEDWMTVNYLRDTALQAGLRTIPIAVEDIGWNAERSTFVGEAEERIASVFKLYPWEWLLREEFAGNLTTAETRWIEPPWKAALSTKALLPLLWELFPDHPNLLPASFEPLAGDCVRKCVHGREGANIRIVCGGAVLEETDGPYCEPTIYQEYVPLPVFDGRRPIIGTWVVGDRACGLGVREDVSLVTRNTSSFVPHVIAD